MTDGGRVLAVTGLGDDLRRGSGAAYAAVEQIHFEGMHLPARYWGQVRRDELRQDAMTGRAPTPLRAWISTPATAPWR